MFTQEIEYCVVGIPVGILFCMLCPGSGIVIWMLTWMLCRDYHNKIIMAILQYGPERVMGIHYKTSWNYAVYCDWLRGQLRGLNSTSTKMKKLMNDCPPLFQNMSGEDKMEEDWYDRYLDNFK